MGNASERMATSGLSDKRIDAEKSKLRHLVLDRRDALDRNMRAWKSARICDALMLEVLDAGTDGTEAGKNIGAGVSSRAGTGCSTGTTIVAGTGFRANPGAKRDTGASIRTDGKADHRPTVAVYAAFSSEADPSAFAQVAELAGWRVAYPCMLPRNTAATTQRMCIRAVSWSDRGAAPFLAHPTHAFAAQDIDSARFPIVPARELDAIIVPLVAFDARGMRLGYGGGCYDRYLPTLSATCKVLGIAFTEQQVEAVPAGEHDLPLPRIITA